MKKLLTLTLACALVSAPVLATKEAPKRVSPVMWGAQETVLSLAGLWLVDALPESPAIRAVVKLALLGGATAKVAHTENKKIRAKL